MGSVAGNGISYEVKPGIGGSSVKYSCPTCATKLTSALSEAGASEFCPQCGNTFSVPGVREKADELRKQQAIQKAKDDQNQQKREEASKALASKMATEAKQSRNLQLDRDPLKEWALYAFVIGLLVVVAAGMHLVQAIATDDSGLCLLIIGLFILGLFLNIKAVRSLRNEFVCAAFILKKLQTTSGWAEINSAPAAGVFQQHIQDLVRIAKHDPNVSQDSLVTLLYSRLMARSKMVDVLSGMLVSLGLIGTVVGLISMTNGLGATLDSLDQSNDPSSLMSGMRATMAGLGTAFYTTLVGAILGSVVLRVLNNVYTSNVDHFVSYIASLTEVRITPRLRRNSRATLQGATASSQGSSGEVI